MVNNLSSKPNHVCVVIAIVCLLRHGTQALDSTASSLSANSECSLEDDHFLYDLQLFRISLGQAVSGRLAAPCFFDFLALTHDP